MQNCHELNTSDPRHKKNPLFLCYYSIKLNEMMWLLFNSTKREGYGYMYYVMVDQGRGRGVVLCV